MSACPNCHVYKGLWSPLSKDKSGLFICKINSAHKFTRDSNGNYHST